MKSISKKLVQKLLNSFSGEYRELYFEVSEKSNLRLLNGKIEPTVFVEDKGFSILSHDGNEKFFKSISEFDNIEKEVESFKNTYELNKTINKIKLSGKENCAFKIYPVTKDINKFSSVLPFLKNIISKYKFIRSYDLFVNLSYKSYIVGSSNGNFVSDSQYYNTFFIILTGEKDGNIEEIYEKITGVEILNLMKKKDLENILKKAINKLQDILNGIPSPSGIMDVIIGNEAGGTIIHEAVGHGLEADLQNSSAYKGKLGQKVAANNVSIMENPTIKNIRGFYNYDHEGIKSKKTYLIKNGILVSYLHNNTTAKLFNTKSTGHARRESFRFQTLVRMGCTYLAPGKDKKNDLIKKVKNGIYVSEMGGGQVNTATGDFVFSIGYGKLIKNGKLGSVIRGGNLSGSGPEMLKNISGICDDLNHIDGGTCGKGQQMPVSDATPTIMVKLKVIGKE